MPVRESWLVKRGGKEGARGPGRVPRMRYGGGGSGLAFRERETQ